MPDPDALPGPARLSRLPSTAVSIRHTVLRTLAHTNWRLALPAERPTVADLVRRSNRRGAESASRGAARGIRAFALHVRVRIGSLAG